MKSDLEKISHSPIAKFRSWVQTDRATHEAWGQFTIKKPAAAAILHVLAAYMGEKNAVVVSQKVLAARLGVHINTVKGAIAALEAGKWIQVVKLGRGKEAAYVVNSRVAWGQPRDELRLAAFSATVIADYDDQDIAMLTDDAPLRKLPQLFPLENQLPAGPGEPPPSQPFFDGLEPDLPSLQARQARPA